MRIRLWCLSGLAAAATAEGLAFVAGPWRAPGAAGAALALALAAPSYLALSATLHRSDAAFFGAYAAGLAARLAVLAGAVLAVHRWGGWPLAPFALALSGGLAALSFIELFFLHRQNQWTSYTRSNTTSSTTSTSA